MVVKILLILSLLFSYPCYSETNLEFPKNNMWYEVNKTIKFSMDNIIKYEIASSNVNLIDTEFYNNYNTYTFELISEKGWIMFYVKNFKQARALVFLRKQQ